jgi:putative Ca2+/H+ antiporter (TMEM165/GDT1 family)
VNWQPLLSTFGLIFVAELGDKTQLAVMTQTCKHRRPWPVFVGATVALVAVTALGAAGGRLLGQLIPPDVLRHGAALAFVVMGVLIWREAAAEEEAIEEDVCCEVDAGLAWDWQAFGSTFSLLFLAELGDKTQLAVLGLAGKQPSPWPVFLGGALALAAVTALGVLGGRQLCRWISEEVLLRVSAGAFVLMGVLMGLGIL